MHRATVLVFAAPFFFILANAFPFLTLRADYRESYIHLVGCVAGLEEQGFPVLAAMVGVFTLAAPTLLIGVLLYVLVPLLRERRLPCYVFNRMANKWSLPVHSCLALPDDSIARLSSLDFTTPPTP